MNSASAALKAVQPAVLTKASSCLNPWNQPFDDSNTLLVIVINIMIYINKPYCKKDLKPVFFKTVSAGPRKVGNTMKSRRIVLVSHCVLNQNSVVEGWSRAKGAVPIVKLLLEEGIGIVQLPCPELICGGLSRPPRSFDDYNTAGYRARCRDLRCRTSAR